MKQPSITSLPPSPDADRRARMLKYTIAMSIRVVCLVMMLFVDGWWLFVCAAGAICLPYVAVVLANVGAPSPDTTVLRPGGVVAIPERKTSEHDEQDRQAS
jgi:predicted cobalt transporter CbtA